ncbi:MAG: trigger factor [Bacteroidetes bacterium]|nr:trigger factor [Bacteroidota bacterium]
MNITLEKKSSTDGIIRISIQENDYQPSVEKKIKDYARKANIKGFRQGKVPAGVIRNMFGKSFLADEVNNLISKSVSGYIRDQKLNVLGDPMPNEEKTSSIDWETQKDFEFEFRVGMAEDFKVDLSKNVKLTRHLIEVTQQTIQEAIDQTKKRYGNISYPEISSAEDVIYGDVRAAGEEEKKPGMIAVEKVEDKLKNKFIGVKKDQVIDFNIEELSQDAETLAQAINVSEEEAKSKKGLYHFTVGTISHTDPATLNQEFFDKVFGKDEVKSEEEFTNRVKETIAKNYERESDHFLDHEIEHHLVDHTTIRLPENFLKEWLKKTGEGKITDEVLEKEFGLYTKDMKWSLIKNRIAEESDIKVEATDVRERAKLMIIEQFGGAAIASQLGDRMDAFADNYLNGNEGQNFMRLYNQLRQERIMAAVKEKVTINDKQISLDEFKKLVSGHRH